MIERKIPKEDVAMYDDGFPAPDSSKKIDETKSKDPSRPFDSGRKDVKRSHNSSGTTMNEPDAFKDK